MDGIDAATIIKSLWISSYLLTALDDMETFQRMMDTRATAYNQPNGRQPCVIILNWH